MPTLCIRQGRILDPVRRLDAVRDLWIVDGRVAPDGFAPGRADAELDAAGLLVMPGFVDVHVHLREPGGESAETIATGCAAALAGGFTTIVAMPNTTPPLDTPERVASVLAKAAAAHGPRVYVAACVTQGRRGEQLADLRALWEAGVVAFTDDGAGVEDEGLCLRAMEHCAELGVPLAQHCEFRALSAGGVMHPGAACARLGLRGYPSAAETTMIERDLRLAQATGARVHFQHLSSARSVALVAEARAAGVAATAELTPHHLTLTDDDAAAGGSHFKMNPPLRSKADRRALQSALCDGTIEIIATDHAPHLAAEKAKSFGEAPFGVVGLETAAAVIWTRFVETGLLTPLGMAHRMCAAPASAFSLPAGTLMPGSPGDVALFDPACAWKVEAARFRSKGRNCPFEGWSLRGRVRAAVVAGEVLYRADLH